ncbi:TM0996/MTH895 family glutaredoxin-like protein [bacterium]|nr:TM0996/MTH895 family glutaredoxin-like protein [bacterium]
MKKIQILGAGCPKCIQLAELAEKAAKETGIDYELVKVTDMEEILGFGVMMTPCLVVNGTVKSCGKVPGLEVIKTMLTE